MSGQELHRSLKLLGIDEILGAAAEESDPESGIGDFRGDGRPAVTEGLVRDGGQGLEAVFAKQDGGQMALERRAAGKRFLGVGRVLEQAVEEPAVLHHAGKQLHGRGVAILGIETAADLADESGQVNAAGADILAGLASHAVLAEKPRLVVSVEEVGQNKADGADIDVAHLVAAHQTEDRADVGTRAAAHAAENLREERIFGNGAAAVVQEDDMHDLAVIRIGAALTRAVHEGDIRGDALARGVTGQNLKHGHHGFKVGDQLVEAGQDHVHAGQRGNHTGVAFVGDRNRGAVFGDGEVTAADAHVAGDEFAAQLHAGHLDQTLDILALLLHAGGLGEFIGHLVAGEVNGRHDHV